MKKLTPLLFIAIMIIVPLYLEHGYYDGLEAKASIYNKIAIVSLPLLGMAFTADLLKKKIDLKEKFRLNTIDKAVLIFAVCIILSCIFSESISESFFGTYGWHVGGAVLLSLTVFYFCITKFMEYDQFFWMPVMVAFTMIMTVIILESMNIDLTGNHNGLEDSIRYTYLATVGHSNWYVGLLCLLVPAFMTFYIESKDRLSSILYLAFSFLAEMNMILCGSDGIYLGFGFALFFILPYILKDAKHLERSGLLVAGIGLSGLIISFPKVFRKKRVHTLGISKLMFHPVVAGTILVVGVLMFLIGKKYYEKVSEGTKKKILIILEIILAIGVIGFIFYNITKFSDTWGTDRGYTWRRSIEIYSEFDLKKKVFGIGLERLPSYYKALEEYFHQPIYVSHSIPIQILLTMGVSGLAGYVIFWITLFGQYFRKKLWKSKYAGFFFSLAAFFAQSFVNSCMVTNAAVFAMILAMYVITNERTGSENNETR